MRITQIESEVLRLPLARPITGPADGDGRRIDHLFLLVVHVDTEAGHRGLGFAPCLGGGGRALKIILDDEIAQHVVAEDPLDHERIAAKVFWRLQTLGYRGLLAQAYSAVDLALWDVKGKIAGLPVHKLLGGARDSAPTYAADTGWLGMSVEEIIEASQPYLEQGFMGVKLQVGHADPDVDADRVLRVREALGEEFWLAIDAGQRYDYCTALSMEHFFEEDVGVSWFEEPIFYEDIEGHARLAKRLEVPITVGESLDSRQQFDEYLRSRAADILRPNVARLGGLTAWLKTAALAEMHHRILVPAALPEIAVHLACGLPQVRMVEYVPWLTTVFGDPPALAEGRIVPPKRPGLGLELRHDAVEKYRVEV